jgi:hypothetical protein
MNQSKKPMGWYSRWYRTAEEELRAYTAMDLKVAEANIDGLGEMEKHWIQDLLELPEEEYDSLLADPEIGPNILTQDNFEMYGWPDAMARLRSVGKNYKKGVLTNDEKNRYAGIVAKLITAKPTIMRLKIKFPTVYSPEEEEE